MVLEGKLQEAANLQRRENVQLHFFVKTFGLNQTGLPECSPLL
jgi:hypothetical protein